MKRLTRSVPAVVAALGVLVVGLAVSQGQSASAQGITTREECEADHPENEWNEELQMCLMMGPGPTVSGDGAQAETSPNPTPAQPAQPAPATQAQPQYTG